MNCSNITYLIIGLFLNIVNISSQTTDLASELLLRYDSTKPSHFLQLHKFGSFGGVPNLHIDNYGGDMRLLTFQNFEIFNKRQEDDQVVWERAFTILDNGKVNIGNSIMPGFYDLGLYRPQEDPTFVISADQNFYPTLKFMQDNEVGFKIDMVGTAGSLHFISQGFELGNRNSLTVNKRGSVGVNTAIIDTNAVFQIKQREGMQALRIENDDNQIYWSFDIGTSNLNLHYLSNENAHGWFNSSDGAYNNMSDRKLKKDITYWSDPVLSNIMQLKPASYRFNWQASDEGKSVGFIAQDIQRIFPDLVSTNEDNILGLNYDNFAVLAVKAIQEQHSIIEQQQELIESLLQRVSQLEHQDQTSVSTTK